MGLFSFLKKLKSPEIQNNKKQQLNTIPTIKPEKELFICYDEVFFNEMKNVEGISLLEAKEILSIIKSGEGGFLNMHFYHKTVYENYFKGRNWTWLEYEYWNDICEKLGKFPVSFPRKRIIKNNNIDLDSILTSLKVVELKEILNNEKIEYQEKLKKNDLIGIVKSIPSIKSNILVIEKIKEIEGKVGYELYTLLMRTIHFRATSLYNDQRQKKAGFKKHELIITHQEDKIFIDMALSKNPNALPPFFPSDLTITRVRVDFLK